MKRNDPIKHVMSTAPQAVQRGEKLSKARQLLGGTKVVGIVTSTGLVRYLTDLYNRRTPWHRSSAS